MKKLVVVAMIFLLGTAWWSTIDNFGVKKAEYRQHIAAAEKYEKQQIYYDAVLEYKNALEENPNQSELWIKIAQDYRNLGSDDEFEEACNQAISLEDDKHEALFMLTDYYLEEGRREDAIALLKRQAEKTKYNGDIKEKLQSLAGDVQTVSADYDEISTECSGYMYVKSGDLYGFLNSSGQEILRPEYQSVGLFGDWGVAPVQKDGESYYIDTNNYKRRQPEEAYQYLGTEKQGIIPAEKDGKWGYLNRQFQPLTEFIYDAATPILDGFGAVKQGESWALIGDDLQMATDFVFSDVLQDEWGFCSRNGVAFVKSGEQYILVDSVEADYVQGEILFNMEDYLEARQIFEACIDKTEDSYVKMRAYIMTARCIDKMESGTTGTQEKIRLLEEAEQELSGDGNIGVLEELAQAYCDAGAEGDDTYYQKAIEIFKQIEKQGMSDYDTEYNLAVLYQNVGDYSNAAETLDNILKTYGEDYRTYKSLAYLEASKQNSLAVDLRNYSKFGEYYKKADELYQKESASNANDADMERLQELYQQAVDNGWL